MTMVSLSCLLAPLLVASFTTVSSDSMIFRMCIYVSPKKSIGSYKYNSGHADVIPYHSFTEPNRIVCNRICMFNDTCLATSFDMKQNICSFYHTSKFYVKVDGKSILYSLWKSCNMNDGDQPEDGRCKGLWVTFPQQRVTVDSFGILGHMVMRDPMSQPQCRNKCLENPLCGFINLNASHCSLIPKWPAENIIYNKTDDYSTASETWTCLHDFIETFNISTEVRKPLVDKCTGSWLLVARHSRLSCPHVIGILFHTQVYSQCLAECELHPTCFRVYFNFTYSTCVLDCIDESDHGIEPPDMTFTEFRWVCLRNDSQHPPMNADEQRLEKLGMKCSKIAKDKDLFIALDRCGTCPPHTEFKKCEETIRRDKKWNIKDSCLVNQSYWAFPTETKLLNIDGHSIVNVTRVFTGLQPYWLAYLDADNLISTDYLECRVFNASRATEKLNPDEIVSQRQWQHQPAIGKIHPFPRKPSKVVITASQQPLHSCRTKAAGIDLMRFIQVLDFHGSGTTVKFYDVPYNFFVDENGNIYEGRGWKLQSASVASFNDRTIAIGFIGWFYSKLPTDKFLNSVKKLIEFGVDHNYIEKEYSLYIHQDLGKAWVRRNLVFVIKNWYRYKGFVPETCSHMSIWIISLNVLAATVCLFVFRLFYNLCFFPVFCAKCKFLSRESFSLERIFPPDPRQLWKEEIFSTVDLSKSACILYEKVPERLKKDDYLLLVRLVKAWRYSKFLNLLSSRCDEINLREYLRLSAPRDTTSEVYEARLKKTYGTESQRESLFVCVSGTVSKVLLQNLIRGGSCICTYYKFEHIGLVEGRIVAINDMTNEMCSE